jgi:DNA-binding IclR family transcriptional regulator
MHDEARDNGSLVRALDRLGEEVQAEVRLGVRNGICVQLVHVSSRETSKTAQGLKPGMKLPVAHDALGRMLLIEESERDLRAILRHANASGGPMERVDPEALAADLRRHRRDGFAVCRHGVDGRDAVLAIRLPSQFGAAAAIGFAVPASQLTAERPRLLGLLRVFAERDWCDGTLDAAGASPD